MFVPSTFYSEIKTSAQRIREVEKSPKSKYLRWIFKGTAKARKFRAGVVKGLALRRKKITYFNMLKKFRLPLSSRGGGGKALMALSLRIRKWFFCGFPKSQTKNVYVLCIYFTQYSHKRDEDWFKKKLNLFDRGSTSKKYNYNVMKVSTLSIFLITMLWKQTLEKILKIILLSDYYLKCAF